MSVSIRPRVAADLPALCEVLAEQQPMSRYPMRWPLPFPVADFIVRPHELGAWTALVEGTIVGHVSVQSVSNDSDLGDLPRLWRAALDPADDRELAAVSALFVSTSTRGTRVGSALLQVATEAIVSAGKIPVLEVVRGHAAAIELYAKRGWRDVGEWWPAWMPPNAAEGPVVAMVLVTARRGTATARP